MFPHNIANLNAVPVQPSVVDQAAEDAYWASLSSFINPNLFSEFDGTSRIATSGDTPESNPSPTNALGLDTPLPVEAPAPTPTSSVLQAQPNSLEAFLASFTGADAPVLNTPALHALTLPTFNTAAPADILPANVTAAVDDSKPDVSDSQPASKKQKKEVTKAIEVEEDKRRRNTEASARFRLKKKEREQALEKRAKELEDQVSILVQEKASLEKENTLLKYLVVNGTAPTSVPSPSSLSESDAAVQAKAQGALAALVAGLGQKRKRD